MSSHNHLILFGSLHKEPMDFPASRFPNFLGIPVTRQKKLVLIIISAIFISSYPKTSQSLTSSPSNDLPDSTDSGTKFRPSLAVVVGVVAVMFALTFLLLLYARCCYRPSSFQYLNQENFGELTRPNSRLSGVDKTVVDSLPVFRFSTLKGLRNGLECSICLSRFEDVEILRLLPKCKHAFHTDCVGQWLEKHSGCPLCRCMVTKDDVTLFGQSSSLRFLNRKSENEGSNLELFIEREGSTRFGSQRMGGYEHVQKGSQILKDSSGRSFGKIKHENNDQEILDQDQEILHKFNHRIIISEYDYDFMMKNRWSHLSSLDLSRFESEMISSNKLVHGNRSDHNPNVETVSSHDHDHQVKKIKEEIGSSNEPKRSMSEIIVHPRFLDVESRNKEGNLSEISAKEERLKRLWLPIARRTVEWFANRDRQPHINTNSHV